MSRQFLINKSEGKIMGVCAGIADYFGIDTTLVRIAFVLAAICGFGSPILIYLIIGFVAPSIR